MWQKFKDALNSSVSWLLFLVGCVLFLWKKERDLQNELAETKAEKEVQGAGEAVKDADNDADTTQLNFEQLSEQYKSQHPDD